MKRKIIYFLLLISIVGTIPVFAEEEIKIITTQSIDKSKIEKETKLDVSNGKMYISVPDLGSIYLYKYTVKNKSTGEILDKGEATTSIPLPSIREKMTIELELEIFNTEFNIRVDSLKKELSINDSKKPKIDYAYVEDGYLHIEYSDNIGLPSDAISYIIRASDKPTLIKRNQVKVNIPSKITIFIKDLFGNELEQTLDIKFDNSVVVGDVSQEILSRLSQKQVSRVENYKKSKNVILIEYGKKVDLIKAFKNLIFENFGEYNNGDVTITSNDFDVDNDGYTFFDKEGLFEMTVSHSFYTNDSFKVYVFVSGNSIIYTNISNIEVNNPFIVYTDKVKLSDYLTYELIKESYAPVTTYIFYRNIMDDELKHIDSEVILDKDKLNIYEIYDLLNDKTYSIELKYVEDFELKSASFSDVKYGHWAYHDIKELTLNKVISGYPDGTFKPDNNITVKEFMSILSRFISKNPSKNFKPTIYNHNLLINTDQWGYIETKSVISRINSLYNFDIYNLDRFITREEVSFLISNTVNFEDYKGSNKYFSDIDFSRFYNDIQKLGNLGILSGYPDNSFKPNNNITRSEIASIFSKLSKGLN